MKLYEKLKVRADEFDHAYKNEDLYHEYLRLSQFIQTAFIPQGSYVIDTGNFQTVNFAILSDIVKKIKKHPLIWRLFFQI